MELASGGEHRGDHDELVGGAHVAGKGAGHGCYCEEQSSKAVRSGKHGRRCRGHGSTLRSVWAGSLCQCKANGGGIVVGDDSGEDIELAV